MECDICSSYTTGVPGLHCPACARAAIYDLRIQYANTLVSRGTLAREVETFVKRSKDDAVTNLEANDAAAALRHSAQLEEAEEARRRIERIMQQNEILRERISGYKDQVAQRKADIARRRAELQAHREEAEQTSDTPMTAIQSSIKTLTSRHDRQHRHLVQARASLCAQAARLSHLRKTRILDSDNLEQDVYTIAGLPLPDLRTLNHVNPRELSAAIASASDLVSTICLYLGLRLPAELTAPHEAWPHPTICSISSSYLHTTHDRKPTFPNYASPSPSPGISRSRPRPLFLDKKLVQLARDDPALYSLFIEGIALFAWDVAWLCRVQGMAVAEDKWEDICDIGRNLWMLLMETPGQSKSVEAPGSAPLKGDAVQRYGTGVRAKPAASPGAAPTSTTAAPSFGVFSHGTSHSFLRSAISTTASASTSNSTSNSTTTSTSTNTSSKPTPTPWKFASPTHLIDKLKAALNADMSGLEWEMLDGEAGGIEEDMQAALGVGGVHAGIASGGSGAGSGRSGWMKVRERD